MGWVVHCTFNRVGALDAMIDRQTMLIMKPDGISAGSDIHPFRTSCKTPLVFFQVSSENNACFVTIHFTGPQHLNSSSKRQYRKSFSGMYHLTHFHNQSGFSRHMIAKGDKFFLFKCASTLSLSFLSGTSRVLLNAVAKAS